MEQKQTTTTTTSRWKMCETLKFNGKKRVFFFFIFIDGRHRVSYIPHSALTLLFSNCFRFPIDTRVEKESVGVGAVVYAAGYWCKMLNKFLYFDYLHLFYLCPLIALHLRKKTYFFHGTQGVCVCVNSRWKLKIIDVSIECKIRNTTCICMLSHRRRQRQP